MAQDWDIKARSELCSECNMQFQDRQQYFSALVFGEEGYVRQDFCGRCWMGGKKEVTSPYSQWQGIFRPPPPPPVEALKKETAESLLRRLIEQDDVSKVNVMYILAIMLERKRILAEKDIQKREDGTKVIVYEHKKTGEVFLIPDPGLQLDQLEHVQIEVVDLLGRHDAAQIPGTETVDPTAPAATSPADGQVVAALPAPDNGIAVVQEPPKAEANAGESPVQAESPAEVEQVVPEEPKIVPEFEKQATPPKATKGRKKTEKTKQVECAKPEPKPAKPAKRVKAVKVAEETAPIETTKPEQAAEKKEEKKPENAPKQKKGVKAIATKDVTTKNKKTTK